MKKIVLAGKAGAALLLMMAFLSLTGCAVLHVHVRENEAIGRERFQMIRCGETTRQDIVTALGPPLATARKVKKTSFPAPRAATIRYAMRDTGPFLELFSGDKTLSDSEAVYYYRSTERDTNGFLLVLILINMGARNNSLKTENLWLLVDEQKGIVENVEYRDADRHRAGCANAPVADRRE
jgi:hypothetical protein